MASYQVKTHIRQLVDLEYLVPVSGRFGQRYRYRPAWDEDGRSAAAELGIKSAEQLHLEVEGATWRP